MKKIMKQTISLAFILMMACPTVSALATEAVPEESPAARATVKKAVKVKSVSKKSGIYQATVSQDKVNYTKGTVTIGNVKKLKKARISKVKITARMYNGKKVVLKKRKTVKISALKKNNKVSLNFPTFGKYKVKVSFYRGKKRVKSLTLKNVGIVAEEYNIAVHNGTFPVLLLTLSLWDIHQKEDGTPIPTFIGLNRAEAYNWKKLPKHVYANPLYPNKGHGKFAKKVEEMAKYVADLHEMNKNSVFHMYLTDNAIKCIMDLAYGNKLTDKQFDLTMISDGAGTYAWFNKVYNKGNPNKKLTSMKKEWNKLKKAYLKGKKPNLKKLKYSTGSGQLIMSKYTYAAAASQENYSWWVARQSNFEAADAAFLEKALTYSEQKSSGDMLAALQEKPKKLKAFKKLYKFSDDLFDEAAKKGKKVMLFMGTRVNLEENFDAFAAFVKKQYGKKYIYYYKGHPGTATKLYPEKQKQLKKLGITDVESSIAAELILFFNPDVKVSNVANSSTNEAYTKGMPKAFNGARLKDKDDPLIVTKGDMFDCFFTKITEDYEEEIRALCKNDKSLKHSFLVEYNDGSGDIAIYNDSENTLKKYSKQDDGSYKAK